MLINKIVKLSNDFQKLALEKKNSKDLDESNVIFLGGEIKDKKEFNIFGVQLSLPDGNKYQGTVKFFPESGKFESDDFFKIKKGKNFQSFDWSFSQEKKNLELDKIYSHPGLEKISALEDLKPHEKSKISDLAENLVRKKANPRYIAPYVKDLTASERKEIFKLVSRGEWGWWKTVKDWGGKIRDLLPGGDEEEAKKIEEEEKKKEEDVKKKEMEEKFKTDTSIFDSLNAQFLAAREESDNFPEPPSSLRRIVQGYKRVENVPSEIVSEAKEMQSDSLWTTKSVLHDDVWYLLIVELHHDDHAGGGMRWHPGVTALAPINNLGEDRGYNKGIEKKLETPKATGQAGLKEKDVENYLQSLESAKESGEINPVNASVVESAIKDLGKKETGSVKNTGERISEYFDSLGIQLDSKKGLPWCAAACSFWLKESGVNIAGSASAAQLANQFGTHLVDKDNFPDESDSSFNEVFMPGNVVFVSKGGSIHHVGVLKSIDPRSGVVSTIDGNSGSDGKQVAIMNRRISDIESIGLVSSLVAGSKKKDLEKKESFFDRQLS